MCRASADFAGSPCTLCRLVPTARARAASQVTLYAPRLTWLPPGLPASACRAAQPTDKAERPHPAGLSRGVITDGGREAGQFAVMIAQRPSSPQPEGTPSSELPGCADVFRLPIRVWTRASSRISASFRVTCFCICPPPDTAAPVGRFGRRSCEYSPGKVGDQSASAAP